MNVCVKEGLKMEEVWNEEVLPIEGKLEYVQGKAEVIELEKGSLVFPKSKKVSVAVWIGGGYMLWIWDGQKWCSMKDKRLEKKGHLSFLQSFKKVVFGGV